MSFIARNSLRAIARRNAPRLRGYATELAQKPTSATSPFLAELEAVEHHAEGELHSVVCDVLVLYLISSNHRSLA